LRGLRGSKEGKPDSGVSDDVLNAVLRDGFVDASDVVRRVVRSDDKLGTTDDGGA